MIIQQIRSIMNNRTNNPMQWSNNKNLIFLEGNATKKLQYLPLKMLSNSVCTQSAGGYSLNSRQICASGSKTWDTCLDTGAPLVCFGKSIKGTSDWVLVGIDSKKLSSCSSGNPIIFTYINQYLGFLIGYYSTGIDIFIFSSLI